MWIAIGLVAVILLVSLLYVFKKGVDYIINITDPYQ